MISSQLLATFEVDSESGYVLLKMKGHGDLKLSRRSGVASARAKVDFILTAFEAKLKSSRPTLKSLADAIKYLDSEMGQIAFMLVGDDSDLLDEVRMRFINAWPQWQYATDVVPLVEVRGHDDDFPFELLPLFDATPVEDFVNYAEVEDTLRRFLGFGVAVRRTLGERVEVANLHADPKLGVQLLRYVMPGTIAEAMSFDDALGQLDVEGPWPEPSLSPEEVTDRLIDALYDPSKTLGGDARQGTLVEIQHFACHCETSNRTDAGYTLILGGPGARERKVTLGAIRQGFRQLKQRYPGGLEPRPLIIANACGSAKIDKETRRSFPSWFLSNRHRGFVGTETDVPDDIAAEFAERLYQELLKGKPLGEAIVLARRRLFSERGSPLGLLYVLYGDPALTID